MDVEPNRTEPGPTKNRTEPNPDPNRDGTEPGRRWSRTELNRTYVNHTHGLLFLETVKDSMRDASPVKNFSGAPQPL